MSLAIDYTALEEEYKAELQEHAEKAGKQKKQLFRLIKFYIWLVIILVSLLSLFLLVGFLLGSDNILLLPMSLSVFSLILGFGGVAFFVYALSLMKINSFETLRKLGILHPFKNIQSSALNDLLTELTERMQMDLSKITMWKVLSPQAYPSVEEDRDGNIHLVMPPHFLVMIKKEPAKAKAILAHELGHVLQSDTKLFLITETYFSVIRTIFIPLVITGLLFRIYLMFFSGAADYFKDKEWIYLGYVIDAGLLYYLSEGFGNITEARKRSEVLADTAALLYTRDQSIITVLQELSDHQANSIHPSKQERLDYVYETLDEFKMAQ